VGILSDRFAAKTLLQFTLCLWAGIILLMTFGTNTSIPVCLALSLGLVVGSTQSLCRSIFARMIEANRTGEMFGFHALVSKMSAVLGPLTFGLVSSATGSQRLGILSLLVFFGLGGLMLTQVRIPLSKVLPLE
jgi:UMF1 family MFS transporter